MGLPVDIQIPTYETKRAILKKKVELGGYNIPDDVQDYVATHIKSSIRELEGALTKLSAFATLSHSPITVEFAEETLKDLISPDAKKEVTPELIIQIVADHFGISPADILSSKRSADIVYPRQITMYLCRQMTNVALQESAKPLETGTIRRLFTERTRLPKKYSSMKQPRTLWIFSLRRLILRNSYPHLLWFFR